MEITPRSLAYFQKVAQLEHLSQAAEELHIAQPSLSHTIRSLEEELQVPLFDHRGRNIVLSRYGRILLRYANQMLVSMDSLRKELADAKEQNHATVTLSIYAASKLIPSLLMAFRREHPNIRFQILQQDGVRQQNHQADINLFSGIHPMDNDHSVTLLEEEIVLAMPKTDPRASATSLPLSAFRDDDFICLQTGKSLRTIMDFYCNTAGFNPHINMECDSPSTVREFIRAGLGISFVPCITWSGVIDDNIAQVHISSPNCRRYIGLSWKKDAYLSEPAIMVRDYLIAHFSEHAQFAAV